MDGYVGGWTSVRVLGGRGCRLTPSAASRPLRFSIGEKFWRGFFSGTKISWAETVTSLSEQALLPRLWLV